MAQLTLVCLEDGQHASMSFPIQVSADDTVEQLQRRLSVERAVISLWCVSIPTSSDELIHLSSIGDREKLEPSDTLSTTFGEKTTVGTINVIIQRPAKGMKKHVFRLTLLSTMDREVICWTSDIQSATLSGIKRHSLPRATKADLHDVQIAIHHPDHPEFPKGSVERPIDDEHLRMILGMYVDVGLRDLRLDLETPNKIWNCDYTQSDGECRYGRFTLLASKLPRPIPLDQSDREAALQRLCADLQSKLHLEPEGFASCFVIHASSLFPDIALDFNLPARGKQGRGTIDIAISPIVNRNHVVGIISIGTLKDALARNMVQLESVGSRPRCLPENRKRKFESEEVSTETCGIVTNGLEWRVVQEAVGSQLPTPPTFKVSKIPGVFQHDMKTWRKDVERIFTHLVCLLNQLTQGFDETDQNKRKRMC
ncbi:MAG: hypothetical protein J3Q66DRAFT_340055 [Benniella sp.]|nr:MAG: hypothetical protein J3Q66DRAFT_340055 [Benniella sp.]